MPPAEDPQLRALIDVLPEATLLVTRRGQVRAANRAARALLGLSRQDVGAVALAALFTDEAPLAPALAQWSSGAAMTPWPAPRRTRHEDLPVRLSGGLMWRDEGPPLVLVRVARDVESSTTFAALDRRIAEVQRENHRLLDLQAELTDQVRERTALLRLSEEETRAIVDAAADAVLIADADGSVRSCNLSATQILGQSADTLLGRRIQEIFEGLDPRALDAQDTGAEATSQVLTVTREDEQQVHVDVTMTGYRFGDVRRVVCIARDVTEREAMLEQLRHRKNELEMVNRELRDFTTVASHDLKEPARKTSMLTQMVLDRYGDGLEPGARDLLRRVEASGQRMQRLIEDLLVLSRVTTTAPSLGHADMNELLGHVVDTLDLRVEETGATIDVEPLPAVYGDAIQLGQLFTNLLGNALKYHRPGVAPAVRITAAHSDARTAHIVVTDNGLGFEPSQAAKIFQPFERLRSEKSYAGTGIGLSICQRVVDRHGGRIWAEGRPGEGATFHIELPSTWLADAALTPPEPGE